MRPFAPVLALLLAVVLTPAPSRAQHDVPVWYLAYDVTMKTNHTAPTAMFGSQPASTTWVLDRSFSAAAKLDMRNEGAVITTAMADPEKFKNMSQADMMKYSQDMLAAMQYTANWMPNAPELGDEPDAMMNYWKTQAVPLAFTYQCTTTGNGLVDENGNKFDYVATKTGTVSGGTLYAGDQYKFEVNTQSKKYWLLLPYTGQDIDPLTRALKWEDVQKTRPSGGDWQEQRKTSDAEIDWLPQLEFAATSQWPLLVEGDLAGPDKIAGEKTFTAHFSDMNVDVPVTITYRYTLTKTPPAAAAKK